jgi:hypothetical protein
METQELEEQTLRCLANTEGPGLIVTQHWARIPLGGTPDAVWVDTATLSRLEKAGHISVTATTFELTPSGEHVANVLLGRPAPPPEDEEF